MAQQIGASAGTVDLNRIAAYARLVEAGSLTRECPRENSQDHARVRGASPVPHHPPRRRDVLALRRYTILRRSIRFLSVFSFTPSSSAAPPGPWILPPVVARTLSM